MGSRPTRPRWTPTWTAGYADAITKGATQTTYDVEGGTLDPAPVGYRITASQYNGLSSSGRCSGWART